MDRNDDQERRAVRPKLTTTPKYDFSDVFIHPIPSIIRSRNDVDTSIELWEKRIDVPVISANMDTVTDGLAAKEMANAGAIGAIHRFMTVEENCKEFAKARSSESGEVVDRPVFVSVGTKDAERERFDALYQAGARWFIIDIAHGASLNVLDMIRYMRSQEVQSAPIKIVAGNVATSDCVGFLLDEGVDGIKVGIAGGSVCTTKSVTGVAIPQFSAIQDCVNFARCWSKQGVIVIADGGVSEYGDIAKALGIGANMVMCGKLFATTTTSIAGRKSAGLSVFYRGMASADAMQFFKREDLPTPEGKAVEIPSDGITITQRVKEIKGALQSSFSYCNAKNMTAFQNNCTFSVRYRGAR